MEEEINTEEINTEETNTVKKTNREILKTVFQMAWPSVLESFFVALAGLIDSFMVSSLGSYAVAAVGLTTNPKFIGLALFIATNVSVSALVARRKGEKDQYGANQVLVQALLFVVAAGLLVSAIFVIFAGNIMQLSGSMPETHESATAYFRIIMGGMIFNIISLTINAAQRGSGNTKIAMRTNVTSNIVNMIFNYLLIGGNFGFPAWGIRGAALATVLGTVVACVMSIASLFKKDNFINIYYIIEHKVRPAVESVKGMVKIASSIFLEQVLLRIGFMSVAVMAAKLGTNAFAAHNLGMNIMSISFSFGDGMQVAAVALIGQSLGERRPELAKRYGAFCQRIGNVISVVLSLIYLLGGRMLYQAYFEEAEIISMGVRIMQVMVVIVLLQIAQVIYMGCLRGAGDVKFTTFASTVSVTVIRPVASYLLCYVLGLGVVGIWLGTACDQLSRFLLTFFRFRSGEWTKIKI